ncbi:MAG TPA: hypothetical protein VL285_18845 [Bryobacteraceae bacterium]|jgi:tetratricopeptide (TPR) repeat protein|nr:hypothetical protein [Bryobacteraceae bacterium]
MFAFGKIGRGVAIAILSAHCCPAQAAEEASEQQSIEPWILKDMLVRSKPDTRVALLDQYRVELQKAELIFWAFDQICEGFEAAGRIESALLSGERLLEADPQAVDVAERGLRAAKQSQDAALIGKWIELRARSASKVLSGPQPDPNRAEIARSVQVNSEYEDFLAMRSVRDPAARRERIEDFLRDHPRSSYRSLAEDLLLESWSASGDGKRRLEAARKILGGDPSNVTALTIVAENDLERQENPNKLVASAARILTLLGRALKPEGMADAEWSRRREVLAARANWIFGNASMQQEKYREADRSIRAALPYLKGDNRMTSAALFYLGWANYRLGRFYEAIRFNQECALVRGPYREHAEKNLQVIRTEAGAASN